jgi:hypothetical protein
MRKINLKLLANLKLKLEILGAKYDEELKTLKEQMLANKETELLDEDGLLSVKLTIPQRRVFDIAVIKAILGEKYRECLTESVDSRRFDSLVKKMVLTEEKAATCYIKTPGTPALQWDGLDAYKAKLGAQS